ncbi:lipase 1-like [Ochlerotatus camptorhynchus]|uniref:lipase 1-like n=1 Tax=Ochlerotatus camptorhynchus TaxID=644619 RepID=UPI0031DD409A
MGVCKCYWLIVLVCTLLNSAKCEDSWFQIDDEDGILSVPDLISKYGYEVENHAVATEDGYELTMFRILPQQPPDTSKLPVLMVHGLLGSSADFIIIGPNNSLAYLLSDNGHEVWLANARGTRYSKKHSTLSLDSKEYWDFSWHEIGYYDLPAMIDYIINATNASKLHYIGFSQGTTVYFVMTSTRPDYNDKVALMVALSPSVFLKRVRSPFIRTTARFFEKFKKFLASHNVYDVFPHTAIFHLLAGSICSYASFDGFCPELIGQLAGPHPESYDQKLITAYIGHTPAGASIKQFTHFGQVIQSGLFRWYDYGREGNIRLYGSGKPPTYDLTLSSAPVLLYYGLNDWLIHPRDVQDVAEMLPRVLATKPVADKKFNHLDFILAKNVRSLVYDQLIQILEEFN